MEDNSILTSVSEITPRSSLNQRSSIGLPDQISQNAVLGVILQEICEKAEELESLGRQYSVKKSNKTPRRSLNISTDYSDIVSRKGQFVDKLTEAVEGTDKSLGIPKYTLHCYNQLNDLLVVRSDEMKQEIQQNVELLKEQEHEVAQLSNQLNIFSNLVEERDEGSGNQDEMIAKVQFEEAKTDLADILNIVFTDGDVKAEFTLVMSHLVEAYVNNLDSTGTIEDRYVELPTTFLNNPGLRCLLMGSIIIQHPHDSCKFRLSVDD